MTEPTPSPVLALVRDLIFSSRITATAKATGVNVKVVRDSTTLANQPGSLLIVDLNQPGFIEAAAEWKATTAREVIGFVSHVDGETIALAKAAGFETLPRSRFVEELESILTRP